MSGAKETLALLAEEPLIYQSLLTGNLKEVARVKVETFGWLNTSILRRAYGGDNHDRAELVPIAQRRARIITGATFVNNQTVLIGDTSNDVRAAKSAGVHIIGVASGKSSDDELMRAGADKVLADLRDAERLRVLITACPGDL